MAKRGNNEGSIYKRDDGRWVASVSLGREDGKPKRKYFYADTRKEAQELLAKAMHEVQQGMPLPVERLTVGAYLDQWLSEVATSKVRRKTFVVYQQLIRLHLKPGLGHKVLAKLTPREVQLFLNKKLDAGLSPQTVKHLHAILRNALNRALKWGLVARNVASLVDPPHVKRYEAAALDPEQARALLRTLQHERLGALYTVPLAIGLRPGEALGLMWSDIDLDRGTLHVTRSLQRIEGKLRIEELKSRSSRRSIKLPEVALASLKAHRIRQAEERLAAGPAWQVSDLIFTTRQGRPLAPRFIARSFKRILHLAGLPDTRVYDLRHTCATLLLVQGVHPRVVMEILGHSQIGLTMNIYTHVVPQLQNQAAGLMDDLLSGDAR
jgi:integrase